MPTPSQPAHETRGDRMSTSRKRWLLVPLLVSVIGLLCSCGEQEGRLDSEKSSDLEFLGGFPRPDMARQGFQSLEGEWDFEYDGEDAGIDRR